MLYIERIVMDCIIALYQNIGTSILLSLIILFLYQSFKLKKISIKKFICDFKSRSLRKRLYLLLSIVFIVQYTILRRTGNHNPLQNIIGPFILSDLLGGYFTVETIENVILFIPFGVCLKNFNVLCSFKRVLFNAFILSLCIEILQLVFKLGTFQFSDLYYNTVGGMIGYLIFIILKKICVYFGLDYRKFQNFMQNICKNNM